MAEAPIPEGDTPAQATLPCEECDETVDVADYCLDCPGALCPSCKTAHQRRKITRNHNIVPYSSPEVDMVKNLAALGKCPKHPGNGMVSFCKKCDEPCCVHCVTSDHMAHDTIDINQKMAEVKKDIESYRDTHVGISANIADEIGEIQKGISQMKIETQQAECQLDAAMKNIRYALDKEEAKLRQQVTDHNDNEISALQKLIAQNETRKSECDSLVVQSGQILNTNIREMIQFSKSKPDRLPKHEKWSRGSSSLCLTPGVVDETSLARMIAVLSITPGKGQLPRLPRRKAKKSDFNVYIKQSFPTESTSRSIIILANGQVLISKHGQSMCRFYNQRGELLKKINLNEVNINIHVVDGNRIIVTDYEKKTVLKISLDGSSLEQLIDTSPLMPTGVCINHKGNIVVMCSYLLGDAHKLVEYSPDGKYKIQEIVRDKTGPLFPQPIRVVQNGNHDYIVSNEHVLVAVSSDGKLRWRNSGNSEKGRTKRTRAFSPDAVCCDRFHNVIVGDYYNDIVDILDSDGWFVMRLLSRDHGIQRPFALATDEQDNLWIGSYVDAKIIIASYLK